MKVGYAVEELNPEFLDQLVVDLRACRADTTGRWRELAAVATRSAAFVGRAYGLLVS